MSKRLALLAQNPVQPLADTPLGFGRDPLTPAPARAPGAVSGAIR